MSQNNPVFNNNFYISNNFQVEGNDFSQAFKPRESLEQRNQGEFPSDEIMKICNSQFTNILPNRISNNSDIKFNPYPLDKLHFMDMMNQFEIVIQLLVQNMLLSSNEETRARTYDLLMKFNKKKEDLLANVKLPQYEISLSKFVPNENNLDDSNSE